MDGRNPAPDVRGTDSRAAVARDLPDLERFLGDINGYGETRTSIVFSTPIPLRGLARLEAG